jgi:hypothetical protein
VLGTVKAKPFGWPLIAASLDHACARRLPDEAGRDEETGFLGRTKKLGVIKVAGEKKCTTRKFVLDFGGPIQGQVSLKGIARSPRIERQP